MTRIASLFVVSADERFVELPASANEPRICRLAPEADDATWQRILARPTPSADAQPVASPPVLNRKPSKEKLCVPPDALLLRPGLWFDERGGALWHEGRSVKRIPLTARELALLLALLRAPSRHMSAESLAHELSQASAYPLDAHCAEQTIYGLRQKLGETARHPGVLHNRRDIGYTLILQPPRDTIPSPRRK